MPFNPQSQLGAEVASQPSAWEAITARLADFAAMLPGPAARVAVIGFGTSYYRAQAYAALKLREPAQFRTQVHPAREYRHGPVSIAAAGRAVWALGEVPDGLAAQVTATGAHFEHRNMDPLAELVRVHRLCLRRARDNDVDPHRPRYLTRSVILAPDADQG